MGAVLAHRAGLNAFSRNLSGPTTAAGSLAIAGSNSASSSVTPANPTLVRQNTASSNGGSTSRTITLPTVGSGHSLVLTECNFDTSAITSVTDSSSNTWTKVVEIAAGASGSNTVGTVSMWVCRTPAAVGSTLTITTVQADANATSAINVSEWSKPLTVRNTSTANTGSGTTAAQSATVTSAANDLVIAAQSRYDNVQQAATSPATALTFVASSSVSDTSAYVIATGTSTTVAWASGSSQQTTTVIASFSS